MTKDFISEQELYNKKWYKNIKKSKLTPPDYVFGIVWPILYLLLIIFFLFAYRNKEYKALIFFAIQFILNLSWTTIFFRLKMLKLGFVIILSIIILSLLCIYNLKNINIGIFMIPYLLWLSLASYLNLFILLNN